MRREFELEDLQRYRKNRDLQEGYGNFVTQCEVWARRAKLTSTGPQKLTINVPSERLQLKVLD